MKMGIPRVITTDQGSEFRNRLNKEMTTLLGIEHRLTTAYHPQVKCVCTTVSEGHYIVVTPVAKW